MMWTSLMSNFFFTEFCGIILILLAVLRSLFCQCFVRNSIYIFAAIAAILAWHSYEFLHESSIIFDGLYIQDNLSTFFKSFLYALFALGILLSKSEDLVEKKNLTEHCVFSLVALLGAILAVSANDLIAFYIAIEVQSMSIFALLAMQKNSLQESLKFFILSAVSSAILIYGISLIYGAVHSSNFYQIINFADFDGQFSLGLATLLLGVLFKMTIFPLHLWAPDVYHKTSLHNLFLLSIVSKIAVAVVLFRLIHPIIDYANLQILLQILASISMLCGAVAALYQSNFKRLLAFSGVVHFSFLLLLIASKTEVLETFIFYLITYSLNILGILFLLRSGSKKIDNLNDFAGIFQKNSYFTLLFSFFLLSMAGFPPFLGFFAKLFVIKDVLADKNCVLWALPLILSSVIAIYFYIKPIRQMIAEISDSQTIKINNFYFMGSLLIFFLQIICIFFLQEYIENLAMYISTY